MHDGDLISREALLAEYDRVHVGEPGGARKLIEEAPSVEAVPIEELEAWKEMLLFVSQRTTRKVSTVCANCGKVVEVEVQE